MSLDISKEYSQFIKSYKKLNNEFFSPSIYQSFSFQQYIKNKYNLTKEDHYFNQSNLLLFYTLEWFKYSKNDKLSLVRYHPYLKKSDHELLEQYKKKTSKSFKIYSLIFIGAAAGFMISKVKLNPFEITVFGLKIISLSVFATIISWKTLNIKINKFIENDTNLKQYLEIDIDKNKILKELTSRGILLDDTDKFIGKIINNTLN